MNQSHDAFHLYPHVRDGLSFLASTFALSKLDGVEYNFEILAKAYCERNISYVYSAFYAILQQTAHYPLFERAAQNFQDGLLENELPLAPELPELTDFGKRMLSDLDLKEDAIYENRTQGLPGGVPLKLPLHLISGIHFYQSQNSDGFSIPPHNVGEVIDAMLEKLSDEQADSDDLCKFIQGPDFACGGTLFVQGERALPYKRGKGAFEHLCSTSVSDDGIIVFFTISPHSAQKHLEDLIKQGLLPAIQSIHLHEDSIVVTAKDGAGVEALRDEILTKHNFRTRVPIDTLFCMHDHETVRRLPLHKILEYFIENRLLFLMAIHDWTRERARKYYQNELMALRERYNEPRRTKIKESAS